MNYVLTDGGVVTAIIVADLETALELGALPSYEECRVGRPYAPPHDCTPLELLGQEVTDMDLAAIEQGQAITDLDLTDVEQGQNATDLELMILGGI